MQSKAQASGWNGVFTEFDVHSYTSQVVAGTNFNVKVGYAEGKFVHVRVFRLVVVEYVWHVLSDTVQAIATYWEPTRGQRCGGGEGRV